ncbi:MAG: GrpB family protein [bacterium]|nr:GrpB family protein [bacterium]
MKLLYLREKCVSVLKRLFWFIVIFLIPSFLLTTFIFGHPWKKIFIDQDSAINGLALYSTINSEFSKYFIGKLLQTSLSLDRYDLWLKNRNIIRINGQQLSQEELALDPEGGAMEITVLEEERKATSTLYAQVGRDDFEIINVGSRPIIRLEKIVYRRPEKFPVPIVIDTTQEGGTVEIHGRIDDAASQIYVQNNLEAWLLKYFAIFVLCSAAILYLKKLFTFSDDIRGGSKCLNQKTMEMVTFKKSDEVRERAEQLFAEQKERLVRLIPSADIQHIGGTAVPGLLTKGDLDLNVRVSKEIFAPTVEKLKELYTINQPANWTNTFASFKDDTSFVLPLGVQVTVLGSLDDHFVKHRDALLNNPALVMEFNELKKKFDGKDMANYRSAKAEFLKRVG